MTRVGGLTKKYYKETKGLKISGGQRVKAGTLLTREGHKWQPGINVTGRMHLTSLCNGEIYFTKKKGPSRKEITYVNVKLSQGSEDSGQGTEKN